MHIYTLHSMQSTWNNHAIAATLPLLLEPTARGPLVVSDPIVAADRDFTSFMT